MSKQQNFTFPKWANSTRLKKAERASARIAYMLHKMAAEHSVSGSIADLARAVGLSPATLHGYIITGRTAVATAEKLNGLFGDSLAPTQVLLDPLSV